MPAQFPTPAVKKPTLEPPAPAPAPEPPASPTTPPAEAPAKPSAGQTSLPDNSGLLTIWVPSDAKVTVNGNPTRSTGSKRQFVSYGLKPGFSYKYEVRAEILRDGKVVSDVQTVVLTAGQRTGLAFGFNKPAAELASN